FLPEMGVAGGTFAVLSIDIDRFLSIAIPNRYPTLHISLYLSMQISAIFAFCAYNAFLIVYFYRDQILLIADHKRLCWTGFAGIFVNLGVAVKVIVYYFTRLANLEVEKLARIFRTIVLVTIFDLGGWALT
ncbi:hypothetical protein PENTCL1PPCAC_14447, partial [Pristionchus entomophagus]